MDTTPTASDIEMVKLMVRDIVTTREDEMDCPECFEHLDHFAELLHNGSDAASVMPRLHEHLQRCTHCRQEFEALLQVLNDLR